MDQRNDTKHRNISFHDEINMIYKRKEQQDG
jgi:hypothetical protein